MSSYSLIFTALFGMAHVCDFDGEKVKEEHRGYRNAEGCAYCLVSTNHAPGRRGTPVVQS